MQPPTRNKKIIFFDGDGTLWYPKSTKWSKMPHWIYADFPKPKGCLKHLILTPQAFNTLQLLKRREMILVALSAHPHKRREADIRMHHKIKHFKLDTIFDYIYTARAFPWGKGEVIKSILKKTKIPKSKAVLIGDNYLYDYLSAKKVGVECILVQTPYLNIPKGRKIMKTIKGLKDLAHIL